MLSWVAQFSLRDPRLDGCAPFEGSPDGVVSGSFGSLFASGFFESDAVHIACGVGALVAVVCGVVGVFTVMRGQPFAGHAFSDTGATGGSGTFLLGVGPLWGFVVIDLLAATAMEMIGIQRARGRDLATGIVLIAGIGLAALFLYLDSVQAGQEARRGLVGVGGEIAGLPLTELPAVCEAVAIKQLRGVVDRAPRHRRRCPQLVLEFLCGDGTLSARESAQHPQTRGAVLMAGAP